MMHLPPRQPPGQWDRVVNFLDTPGNALVVLGILTVVWALLLMATGDPGDVSDALTGLAILVGGVWTLYQFVLRRSFESALDMSVEVTSGAPADQAGACAVTIAVQISNIGSRRITAPPVLTGEQIVGAGGSIEFPADLQLRRVRTSAAPAFLGWWTDAVGAVEGIPEHIPLLYEYSVEDDEASVDFFMEPGEKYTLVTAFRLPAGDYLAKIVFVGGAGGRSGVLEPSRALQRAVCAEGVIHRPLLRERDGDLVPPVHGDHLRVYFFVR